MSAQWQVSQVMKKKPSQAEQIRRLKQVIADEDKYFPGVLGNPVTFAARWGVALSKRHRSKANNTSPPPPKPTPLAHLGGSPDLVPTRGFQRQPSGASPQERGLHRGRRAVGLIALHPAGAGSVAGHIPGNAIWTMPSLKKSA